MASAADRELGTARSVIQRAMDTPSPVAEPRTIHFRDGAAPGRTSGSIRNQRIPEARASPSATPMRLRSDWVSSRRRAWRTRVSSGEEFGRAISASRAGYRLFVIILRPFGGAIGNGSGFTFREAPAAKRNHDLSLLTGPQRVATLWRKCRAADPVK